MSCTWEFLSASINFVPLALWLRSDLMETQAVNWGALDALVLDYVDQEQLLEDSGGGRPYDPNLNIPREIISIVRLLIEAGHITESLHLLQQHAQIVLEDPRLLFRLYKQVSTLCRTAVTCKLLCVGH